METLLRGLRLQRYEGPIPPPVRHSTGVQSITAAAAQWRSVKSCDIKLHSLRGSYSTPNFISSPG